MEAVVLGTMEGDNVECDISVYYGVNMDNEKCIGLSITPFKENGTCCTMKLNDAEYIASSINAIIGFIGREMK